MSDAVSAVQKALLQAINAAAIGLTCYDPVPANAQFPYAEFGSDDAIPADADCIEGEDIVIVVHVWGRDQGALQPTRALTGALRDAVHEVSLTLDDPYAAVNCRVISRQTFMDPDGITAHGVVRVAVIVQRVS